MPTHALRINVIDILKETDLILSLFVMFHVKHLPHFVSCLM